MEEKIRQTMASVFMCEPTQINENTSQDTLPEWDSLRHMNLIVALEEDFGITFTEDEMVEMLSYKLICDAIRRKNLK